jgi:hypothetical protein
LQGERLEGIKEREISDLPKTGGGATQSQAAGANTLQQAGANPPEKAGATTPEKTGATTPEKTGATTPEKTGATTPEKTGATTPEKTEVNIAGKPGAGAEGGLEYEYYYVEGEHFASSYSKNSKTFNLTNSQEGTASFYR